MTSAVEAAVEAADEVSQSIRIRILCVKYSLNPPNFLLPEKLIRKVHVF